MSLINRLTPPPAMIAYSAVVDRVHDGDTFHAILTIPAVGFGLATVIASEVRLGGINAPELIGASAVAGEAATIALMNLIGFVPNGKRTRQVFNIPGDYLTASPVTLKLNVSPAKEREKYGRVLAIPLVNGVDVCAAMVAGGFAVVVNYGMELSEPLA